MLELPDPTDCPYYLITRASLVITAQLKREFALVGVHQVRPAYLGVLLCLWRGDGQKAVELGRQAGLEPSSMTGLLDRMERDGLICRRDDPDDRRAQRIMLTKEGNRVKEVVMAVVDRTLENVLQGVPERDLTRLKGTLRRLLANTDRWSSS